MAATKPDKNTVKVLKGVSKGFGIEMPIIKEKFNKLIDSRAVKNLTVPNEVEREKHAVRILVAELTAERDRKEFSGKVTPVTIRIESKESISDFKRAGTDEPGYRSGLYVTMQDEDDNVNLAKLTLWNDACECHPNLVVGETYSTNVVIGNRGNIWETSMNEPQDVEDSDVELKPMSELISDNFTPIGIPDVENNISKDRQDLKLVEGVVVSGWAKVVASGRDMGFLKIMGDFDPDEAIVAKFSGDANCVNSVGAGDLVYVLGQTTPAVLNDDGTEQYSIGMWGELIILQLGVERAETDAEESDEEQEEDPTGTNTIEDDEESLEDKIDEW